MMVPWSEAREGLRRGERWKLAYWADTSALSAADLPAIIGSGTSWHDSNEWVRVMDAPPVGEWRRDLPRDRAVALASMSAGVSPEAYALYFEATCCVPSIRDMRREADLSNEIVATEII